MNRPGQKTAMISSTALDLPDHRHEAIEACLRQDVFPIAMEHLPASDADAIRVSLAMVDKADIYIGVYGWRYGHVPNGYAISITEMEFNRAVERGIPILVFLMHEKHPLESRNMVEADATAQQKLEALKKHAADGRGRLEFRSAIELRSHIIQSLSALLPQLNAASGKPKTPDFHPPNLIPKPPEPYIAHPYSLLQTKDVVGRQDELNLLTDWVTTNRQVPADTGIFNLVAIGGMGKSALTWKWFNDIAPNELPKLAGRLWWSFYESDAHWENFIIRALAYVSGQSEKAVRELKAPDREDQLWRILDQQPFLLVLDGLERILLAYARMDAAQMLDEDLDDKTANRVAQAIGLPQSAADSIIGKHQLRLTADHRAANFLRRLTQIRNSRILITTRLYPTELQCETGAPLPGCFAQFLTGLTDSDARNLWREFKVTGSTEQLLPLFRSFNNYPLLIRALAGEVAAFRGGPGDFDKWRAENPKFDPTLLPLKNAKTHVLEYALHGLKPEHRQVLHTIAAFRMPATWETLRALLVEQERGPARGTASTPDGERMVKRAEARAPRPCATDQALDLILTELEDRGLVGWDKKANRYDLHPIVRGVVWLTLNGRERKGIYQTLYTYFKAMPKFWNQERARVQTLDDLAQEIEIFNALVGLERFDDAFSIFQSRLKSELLERLFLPRKVSELLRMLFPEGLEKPPRLSQEHSKCALLWLGQALAHSEDREMCVSLLRRHNAICERKITCPLNVAWFLKRCGELREAEAIAWRCLLESRIATEPNEEALVITHLGMHLAKRGEFQLVPLILARASRIGEKLGIESPLVRDARIQLEFQMECQREHYCNAAGLVEEMHQRAKRSGSFLEIIDALGCRGWIMVKCGLYKEAVETCRSAMEISRNHDVSVSDLWFRTIIAEAHRMEGNAVESRTLFEDDIYERMPDWFLRFTVADALNILAHIEYDLGNRAAAIATATKAYTLAWCDGISADGKVCYAYHYGLTNARKHLQELGAPEPQLPPFDESKFPPLPNVELNPQDEFWVDPASLDSSP